MTGVAGQILSGQLSVVAYMYVDLDVLVRIDDVLVYIQIGTSHQSLRAAIRGNVKFEHACTPIRLRFRRLGLGLGLGIRFRFRM